MIKKIIHSGFSLSTSKTARYLYWVFSGNVVSIILTFFTTILVARYLTTSDNGLFLALFTFANLLSELGELGMGSGLSKFIPPLLVQKREQEAQVFLTTAYWLELTLNLLIAGIAMFFAPLLSRFLFASIPPVNVIIAGGMDIALVMMLFVTFALGAYKKFQEVAVVNIGYSFIRLLLLVIWAVWFKLTITSALVIYVIAAVFGWLYGQFFLGHKNLKTLPTIVAGKRMFKFSLFLAFQKGFIATSSRLDMLMLVPLANALEAGVYGIASRFALVYPVVIGSLGQVLAPRFAEYVHAKDAMVFFRKVGVLIGLLLLSEVVFYFLVKIVIYIFLPNYISAIPVLMWLLVAMIGFIAATPFVSLLIYTLHKPQVTTLLSGVQLAIIFLANWYFIPRLGRFGPIIGIGLGNIAVLVLSIIAVWYFLKK